MNFAWPWFALLMPLLFLLPAPKTSGHDPALHHPYLMALGQPQPSSLAKGRSAPWSSHLIWIFLVFALMRPQWIGEPVQNTLAGRSLFLSVDLSESMLEQDMSWNGRPIERYKAVQAVVGEFVDKRNHDFIGLVVFGSFADIQSPLTPDTHAIRSLLNDLQPGMAGGSTAIGDGIALAVKHLRESDSPDKVIILLSDGENRSGSVSPEQATTLAVQNGITIHTIAFGSDASTNLFGFMRVPSAQVDEKTLREIAEKTNGQSFRAVSTDDLKRVFDLIDSLEPSERNDKDIRLVKEWYAIPLGLSFCLLIMTLLPKSLRGVIR